MTERCVLQPQFSDYTLPDPRMCFFMGLQRQFREAITVNVSPIFISTGARQNNVKGLKQCNYINCYRGLGHIRLNASQQHLSVTKQVQKISTLMCNFLKQHGITNRAAEKSSQL